MATNFINPGFSNGDINLSVQDGEVRIYGTNAGLNRLINLCQELIDNPAKGHVHLGDYNILTKESFDGVIALFPDEEK